MTMDRQDRTEDQEINLLELMQVLVKRKKLIVRACCATAAVSVVFALLLPNIYSATAKVLPPQKDAGGSLSALLGQAGGLAGIASSLGGLGGGSDLYIGILKSRSVADAVIQRLDLMKVYEKKTLDETRRVLDKTVKAQAGKDGIISITAEDENPKRAAQLANAFVDELGKTTVRLNLTKAGTERVFLEKRLEVVKRDLKAAEEDIKGFALKNKIVQADAQTKAAIEGIARIKADLASKEVQLAVLTSKQTEESPEVQAVQAGISRLRGQLSRLAGKNGYGEGIPSVGSVPTIGLEYLRKMRELKTQEAVFEQLMKQYEIAKLNEAKDSSSLQVLDEAVVPLKKSKPLRAIIVLSSTIAALFFSAIYAFIMEFFARMPASEKELLRSMKKEVVSARS